MEKKANTRPMYSYYGQNPTTSLYRLGLNYNKSFLLYYLYYFL